VGDQGVHLQVDAVRPSEADDVALVSGGDCDVGGATDYVVFFADGGVG
jgi:precorrin-3B methylase